ncbi:MAG: methionyl-tRNA formyltransferase [Erysipelotrichaceae bacterium]|nr:methionyl-tRNA formyltransferase [Erysipelotrichaceae bacterium]
MKIVFMGTPTFAVPILNELYKKYEIVLVVSQPNRVKKKGVFIPTPVAEAASMLNLKLFQPERIKDDYDAIINSGADILITAAYGQYVPSKILNSFKYCLNVHGSLLPYHRGGAPIQRCLINGDEKTGVCIMEMTKRLDAGKVYAFKEYDILPEDNNSILFEKLSMIGRDLLMNCIEDIYNGNNQGVSQNEEEATYSPNISPEEEIIDLNNTSKNIVNQIRGLSYEPGAYLKIDDIKLKVFKAREISYIGEELPGTVLDTKKRIVLKTKDSAIELLEVLYPGKRILSGKDFSNGQKIFVTGDILK